MYLITRIFSIGMAAGLATGAWAGEAKGELSRSGPGRLQNLERRAEDRDALARRCEELQRELTEAKAALADVEEKSGKVLGREGLRRLDDLEAKALAYDSAVRMLKARDAEIVRLNAELEEERAAKGELQKEIDDLNRRLDEMAKTAAELEVSEKSLRSTVEQLLFGNFEYYEVRQGETLSSIAERDVIYGDASKAEWLRQANRTRVENIDELRPGEVLIIPRFPPSGRYDF